MSEKGFIKIDRAIEDWEYWGRPEAVALWLHILVNANWTVGYFRGIKVNRGEFITSLDKLAKEVGLTTQKLRTLLALFEKSENITRKTTNKYTVIKVVKYDTYQALQSTEQQANQQTNNKQITNKQQTNNNNIRIIRSNKKNKKSKKRVEDTPPPTLDEVISFCKARHSNINPMRFYNYYNQRDWLVNGTLIDWRQKVRDWETNEYNTKPRANETPTYIRDQKLGKYTEGTKAKKETLEKVKELQGKGHGK